MTKKQVKAATRAPAAPQESRNGAPTSVYETVQHIVRTLSPSGGPWEGQVINPKVANEEISRRMMAGWDVISFRPLRVSENGIDVLWILGKVRPGGTGKGFIEARHVTKVIMPGLSAQAPAVTAARANTEVAEMLADGWVIVDAGPVGTYGPDGFPVYYLFCK